MPDIQKPLAFQTNVTLAILLTLLCGIIQLLMTIFRLGFVVRFISHPVITGFTSAASIVIATTQLKVGKQKVALFKGHASECAADFAVQQEFMFEFVLFRKSLAFTPPVVSFKQSFTCLKTSEKPSEFRSEPQTQCIFNFLSSQKFSYAYSSSPCSNVRTSTTTFYDIII